MPESGGRSEYGLCSWGSVGFEIRFANSRQKIGECQILSMNAGDDFVARRFLIETRVASMGSRVHEKCPEIAALGTAVSPEHQRAR
jgi:hypothetical protein